MGLLNRLLGGGAEGCRKSMRDAYEHHAKAAREKHMDSPHLIGLYRALRSRYRARGLAMDEAVMWGELAPFLAMEPAMSIVALSEYVAFQEQHVGVRRDWLTNIIRRAMQAPKVGTMTEVVRLAVVSRVAWCELLDPATVAALEGEPDTEGESAAQAQRQIGFAAERQLRSRAFAPATPRRMEMEDWIRRHPKPKPAYEQRWRKTVVMWSTLLSNTKEPNHDQLKRDQILLKGVSDDYPAGGGLSHLRPQQREATKNWARLIKKYLGIDVS